MRLLPPLAERTGRSVAFAPSSAIVQKLRKNILKDRFMALHMMIDRMNPDDPSSAPATIRSLLSMQNPSRLQTIPHKNSEGDNSGHIGAADRDNQQDAEQQ